MAQTTLRALADQRGLRVGSGVRIEPLRSDPAYREVLAREYNCAVAEREMKFALTQPRRGDFDFAAGDEIAEFARGHEMALRGHCLVWHHPRSLPQWFKERSWSRSEALEILREHVQAVVSHYRGRVFAWDVVNEGVEDETFYREDSPWYRAIGPDYIERAFRWAHEADPDALLFLNDYGMDEANRKADHAHRLARDLRDRGVPIHGVGLQYHVRLERPPDPPSVAENIRRFNALGLAVHLTEMDVWLRRPWSEDALARQAAVCRAAFEAALGAEDCPAVLSWDFTDRYSWVPGFTKGEYGGALPFDSNYRSKPAYDAIRDVLAQ